MQCRENAKKLKQDLINFSENSQTSPEEKLEFQTMIRIIDLVGDLQDDIKELKRELKFKP